MSRTSTDIYTFASVAYERISKFCKNVVFIVMLYRASPTKLCFRKGTIMEILGCFHPAVDKSYGGTNLVYVPKYACSRLLAKNQLEKNIEGKLPKQNSILDLGSTKVQFQFYIRLP
ncbi:hypothetical protein VNO78_26752 [Psophocarpus tetragonolobus]|uniref:Uncharacterized protein n=1 Tax=Psophocarpus tetragonolobus TaxID=3891 RepID=A0AAN9S0L9_PSOTE